MCQEHHTSHLCGCTTVSRIVNLCRLASSERLLRRQPGRPCKASRSSTSSYSCMIAPHIRQSNTFCAICSDDGSDASVSFDSENDSSYAGSDAGSCRDENGEFIPLSAIYKRRKIRQKKVGTQTVSTFDRYLQMVKAYVWWVNALPLWCVVQTGIAFLTLRFRRLSYRKALWAVWGFAAWYVREVHQSVFPRATINSPKADSSGHTTSTITPLLTAAKWVSKRSSFLLILGICFPIFAPSLCADPSPSIPFLCYLIGFIIIIFSGIFHPITFIRRHPLRFVAILLAPAALVCAADIAGRKIGRQKYAARRYEEGQDLLRQMDPGERPLTTSIGPGFAPLRVLWDHLPFVKTEEQR